ncbi:hypothetical protein D3C72_1411890 [compost metagenome]
MKANGIVIININKITDAIGTSTNPNKPTPKFVNAFFDTTSSADFELKLGNNLVNIKKIIKANTIDIIDPKIICFEENSLKSNE